MHPAPVISVAVAAVVALDAKAQRLAVNFFPIKNNLAGKGAVGMWRAGKADPALIAERFAKI
jgi:hypothetical protein